MPEVVNSHVLQPGALADASPGALEIGEMGARHRGAQRFGTPALVEAGRMAGRSDGRCGIGHTLDVVHVEQRCVQARPAAPVLQFYLLQARVEDIFEHLAHAVRECSVHCGRGLVEERDEVLEVGFLADDLVDDAEQWAVLVVGLDEALDAGDQVGR